MTLTAKKKAWQAGGPTVSRKDVTAQGRLLRGYLHKTSNSLCGIKGYASLIADDGTKPENAGDWARKIIAEVERMEAIFHSVGDLTGGRRIPDLETSLLSVLQEVVRLCERTFANLEIRSLGVEEGEVLLPAADLALILQEILKNSAEAAVNNSNTVTAKMWTDVNERGNLILVLQDDGPGIAAPLLPQVVDPFLTSKPGSMGMGLTRVETLMEMYDLSWDLRSEQGQGTCVTLEVAAPQGRARTSA